MPSRSFLIRGIILAIACVLLLPAEGKAAAQTVRRKTTPRYTLQRAPAQSRATVCRRYVRGGDMYKSDPFGYRQTDDLIIPGLGTKKRGAQCTTARRTTASSGGTARRSTSKIPLLGKNGREGSGAADGDFSYYLSQLQEERAKGGSRALGGDAGIVLLAGDSDRNSSNVLLYGPGDEDGDGITNGGEELLGTDPLRSDTDRDGVDDLSEVGDPRFPLDHDHDGVLDGLDPGNDSDRDGLSNSTELDLGTHPLKPDTDGDSVLDGLETGNPKRPRDQNRNGKMDALDPDNDSDCDGLSNSKEKMQGSSALDPFDPGLPSPSFGCEEGAALPRTGVDVGMMRSER